MSEEQEGQNFLIERKTPLEIKEKAPQTPEVPWNQWLSQLNDRFKYWLQREEGSEKSWPPKTPNLPEQHYAVWYEIPNEYSPDIVKINEQVRSLMGSTSDKIFYRPGIGFGGVLYEMLGKIGTYHTLVVSDPVYEGKEMVGWSEGLLPVDYYLKS